MTESSMLKYQYDTMLDQLILLQLHAEDLNCPCSLKGVKQGELGEFCEPKHTRAIVALARETIAMEEDDGRLQYLDRVVKEGTDLLGKMQDKLCGKEADVGDYLTWSREVRKPLELICYNAFCRLELAEAEEPSPLLAFLEEEMAKPGLPAPFGWVGGKHQLSKTIVEMIPPHKVYVEPFCGSAAVFWRHPRSEVEVLNDADADLMRFYREMGDISHCDIKSLSNRFEELKNRQGKLEPCEFLSVLKCSFGDKRENRAMPSDCRSNAMLFHKRLPLYQERIKGVKLVCGDWAKVVLQYDSPDTFFFLDPPYHGTSRGYQHGEDQLARLATVLPKLKGKWLLSYDDDPEVRASFEARAGFKGFNIQEVASRYTIGGLSNDKRGKQLLIANYPLGGAGLHEGVDACQEARSSLMKYLDDVKAGHTEAAQYWRGHGEAMSSICVQAMPGRGAMAQDDFKEVGPYLVHRYNVLGTGIMVYDVYEPDDGNHATIMSIKGKWWGTVGSRILPEGLAKLPSGGERVRKVMRWQEDNYREAYGTILEAYPELKNRVVRWSSGEAVTLKEAEMGNGQKFKWPQRWDDVAKKADTDKVDPYIIWYTLERITKGFSPETAFAEACEDQNYYGDRPDIVKERRKAARHLKKHYGVEIKEDAVERIEPYLKEARAGEKNLFNWLKGEMKAKEEGKILEYLRKHKEFPPDAYVFEKAAPYHKDIPSDLYYYRTTIEKHYLPSSACHKGSIRVVKPTVGTLVYMGCLRKDKWDEASSTCSPNPTVLMTIVLNNKKNHDEAQHLKLVHPEIKEYHKETETGVEPRVAEGEDLEPTPGKPELVEVVKAMKEAEEI